LLLYLIVGWLDGGGQDKTKMDINLKDGTLLIKHKLRRDETYKISKNKRFQTISIFKKPQIVNGISSYCGNGDHVLFIDFDDVPKWLVLEDYKRIQKNYSLPSAYLFTTKEEDEDGELFGNYHIICLKKASQKRIYEIISNTHADINFMSMPLRRKWRNWTLRISTKTKRDRPKFVSLIGEDINNEVETSSAHKEFLSKIYNKIKHPNYTNLDSNKKIYLQKYETN